MSEALFKYELDERGVGTVMLSRPDIHNAFNDELIVGLTELFQKLEQEKSIRLIVLTGEGKSFCAGADLKWMKRMVNYSQAENIADSKKLAQMFDTLNNCSIPILGKINGPALGGGAGLVAICDYALSSESASFGFTEVRLGLIPAVISPYVIAKVGEGQARAYFLSGERFNAFKAQQMGLVHQVCSKDDLEHCFNQVVQNFLQAGPEAAREAKRLVRKVLSFSACEDGRQKRMQFTCEAIAGRRVSEEGQEGMNALLEKRNAKWL